MLEEVMVIMFRSLCCCQLQVAGFINQLLVCLCLLMSQGFRFTIVERQAKCLHIGDPESDGCQILSCNALLK